MMQTSSVKTSTRLPIRSYLSSTFANLSPLSISVSLMKRQLAFLLARAQIPLEWLHPPADDNADADADADFQDELPEDLLACLSNSRLYTHFREFGKELGVAEPKSLEDVYKSHLENTSNHRTSSLHV